MPYSSAVLFAALMMWGSMSPVFACRGASNATMLKPSNDRFVSAGRDQYNIRVDPGSLAGFVLVTEPSHEFGFCVDVSVLDSSDLEDTVTSVVFWSIPTGPKNDYSLQIRNGQYRIIHVLFGKLYELVPWTTEASIKKGLRQKNEVDLRVTATGADVQINGTQLTDIVSRPSADAQDYGVIFATPKTGTGLFQLESPRIVK
jgi:hypothetical protein